MPDDVHPQIQAIIDRANELGLKPVQTMEVAEGRAQIEALSKAGRKAFPSPVVDSVENTSTGPGYGHVPVRIYRTSTDPNRPVIVYYHGGGHVVCSLDSHDTIARYLARETGYTVVSVDYRMGPEYPFPAAVLDSYDATRWVAHNAAELRVDPSKLVVCGDSAGANLAAVMALMARDAGDVAISAQVLIYPVIDYRGGTPSYERYGEGYGSFGADTVKWFMERYLPDPQQRDDWRACPSNARLTPDLPATLVITAECDVLHDEAVAYFEQLQQAGVDARHKEFQGMTHGFFGFLGQVDAAHAAHETVAAFLNKTV